MPLHPFFGPTRFGIEFIYTIIAVFLCFLVYFKTRGIYNLTKYKGIGYFRNAFLLFGLAYASRFILHLLTFTTTLFFDVFIQRRIMLPLTMVPVGYLSTMAMFYLTYSTIWKKIRYGHFVIFSNATAIIVSAIAFISRSHILLSLLQLLLLLFTLIISAKKHEKEKKKSHMRVLYLLVSIFWLINLFLVGPRMFLPFGLNIILELISIIVFVIIAYRVVKWVK